MLKCHIEETVHAEPGTDSSRKSAFSSRTRLAAVASARSVSPPRAISSSAARPAAAEAGFALNVPWWLTRCLRFQSASCSRISSSEITSSRPVTQPPGSPPARIFACVERSGITSQRSEAPPGATRKPVITSSMMNSVPYSRVSSRAACR